MKVSKQSEKVAHPSVILTLAYLLEKMERHPGPIGAEQHRWVVNRLAAELATATPGEQLESILEAHPAATELYENLNYAHSGLCRHDLDTTLCAERDALRCIERARAVGRG